MLEYLSLCSFIIGFLAYYSPLLIFKVGNKSSTPIWTIPSSIYHIVMALWRGSSENLVAAVRPVVTHGGFSSKTGKQRKGVEFGNKQGLVLEK